MNQGGKMETNTTLHLIDKNINEEKRESVKTQFTLLSERLEWFRSDRP